MQFSSKIQLMYFSQKLLSLIYVQRTFLRQTINCTLIFGVLIPAKVVGVLRSDYAFEDAIYGLVEIIIIS